MSYEEMKVRRKRGYRSARCARCRMAERLCVCALLPVLSPRTRIVVVAHPQELDKPTNTGRYLPLSLDGAALVTRRQLTGPPPAGAAVLFPAADACPLRSEDPPSTLYVPDGTYRQARRILKREEFFSEMPRVCLPRDVRAVGHMRRGARADHLSTYEAVARALGIVEGPHLEAPMIAFLEIVVKRTLWSRGSLAAAAVPGGIPLSTSQS